MRNCDIKQEKTPFGGLFSWIFSELLFDNYTLDFDFTVIVHEENHKDTLSRLQNKTVGLVCMDSGFLKTIRYELVSMSACLARCLKTRESFLSIPIWI